MTWELNYALLLIGILCDFLKLMLIFPWGYYCLLGGIQVIFYPFTYCETFFCGLFDMYEGELCGLLD